MVAAMVMYGIDASSAQHDVDWATVDASTGFGFEKVSQGRGYVNPNWPLAASAMAARAKAAGCVPGAYLFLEQGNGAAQADWFAQHAGDLAGFALAVDIEPWPGGSSRPSLADGIACVTELRKLYPHHPVGGYIPQWYWDGADTTFCDWLWPSHYLYGTGTPRALYPGVPASWWDGYGGRPARLPQVPSSGLLARRTRPAACPPYPRPPAPPPAPHSPHPTPPPPPPP